MKLLIILLTVSTYTMFVYPSNNNLLNKYQELCESKDAKSCVKIGNLYRKKLKNNEEAFKYVKKGANLGSSWGMNYLGWMYEKGLGTEINISKAEQLYKKASDLNNTTAMTNLGNLYSKGKIVEQNIEKAIKYYKMACENKNAKSCVKTGNLYRKRLKNNEEAFKYIKRGATLGSPWGMNYLGWMYEKGRGTKFNIKKAIKYYEIACNNDYYVGCMNIAEIYLKEKNYEEAVKWYERSANKSHTGSQYALAVMYFYGQGIPQNYKKAFNLFEKATNKKHLNAQYSLALMYWKGIGINKDYEKAFKLFQKGVNKNHIPSYNCLSEMYYAGHGVKKNYKKTFQLLKIQAYKNDSIVQFKLGYLYQNGIGVDKNITEAINWYGKAAKNNNILAMNNLAILYKELDSDLSNNIVIKNKNHKILELLEKASIEKTNFPSQYNLGQLYLEGNIVKQDLKKAKKFFMLASKNNNKDSKKILNDMEQNQSIQINQKTFTFGLVGGIFTSTPIFSFMEEIQIKTYWKIEEKKEYQENYSFGECNKIYTKDFCDVFIENNKYKDINFIYNNGLESPTMDIAIEQSNKYIIAVSHTSKLNIYDLNGKLLRSRDGIDNMCMVQNLDISKNGKYILHSECNKMTIYSYPSLKPIFVHKSQEIITDVKFLENILVNKVDNVKSMVSHNNLYNPKEWILFSTQKKDKNNSIKVLKWEEENKSIIVNSNEKVLLKDFNESIVSLVANYKSLPESKFLINAEEINLKINHLKNFPINLFLTTGNGDIIYLSSISELKQKGYIFHDQVLKSGISGLGKIAYDISWKNKFLFLGSSITENYLDIRIYDRKKDTSEYIKTFIITALELSYDEDIVVAGTQYGEPIIIKRDGRKWNQINKQYSMSNNGSFPKRIIPYKNKYVFISGGSGRYLLEKYPLLKIENGEIKYTFLNNGTDTIYFSKDGKILNIGGNAITVDKNSSVFPKYTTKVEVDNMKKISFTNGMKKGYFRAKQAIYISTKLDDCSLIKKMENLKNDDYEIYFVEKFPSNVSYSFKMAKLGKKYFKYYPRLKNKIEVFNKCKKVTDIYLHSNGYVSVTPEGFFSGVNMNENLLTIVNENMHSLRFNQLYNYFFRPDLIKIKLLGNKKLFKGEMKKLNYKEAIKKSPPKLEFIKVNKKNVIKVGFEYSNINIKKEKIKLLFNINENDNGGIGLIRIYQEGKLIQTIGDGKVNKQSANIDTILEQEEDDKKNKENQTNEKMNEFMKKAIDGTLNINDTIANQKSITTTNKAGDYEIEIELISGQNEIGIEAFNKTNTVTSYRETIVIDADIPKKKAKLYAIVVGVDDFESKPKKYHLNYAEKDALSIKKEIETKIGKTFDEVEVKSLIGKEVTRANILKSAKEIALKAKLEDTIIFYISTHGRAVKGNLYFAPYNNAQGSDWINFQQTFKAIQSIKALNQIFIVDACESGQANDIVSAVYDSRASILVRSAGVHMLLATTKGAYAFEPKDKSKNVMTFTQRILKTLRDKESDKDGDGFVSIVELSKSLKEPKNIVEYQYPVIRNVGGDIRLRRVD